MTILPGESVPMTIPRRFMIRGSATGDIEVFVVANLAGSEKDAGAVLKAVEVAVKYGFLGFSVGGRNGVFYLRPTDRGMRSAIRRLLKRHQKEVEPRMGILEGRKLKEIKIVSHGPSGRRLVGIMDEKRRRAVLLGFASYS